MLFGDTPTACTLDVPWLMYSVVKGPEADGLFYQMHDVIPGYQEGQTYTRGCAAPPFPDQWHAFLLSSAQLAHYARCLNRQYPWAAKSRLCFGEAAPPAARVAGADPCRSIWQLIGKLVEWAAATWKMPC